MKLFKYFSIFLAVFFLLSTAYSVRLVKIAYVDIEEVFNAYPGTKLIKEKLAEKRDELDIEIMEKREEIAKLKRDYENNADRMSDLELQRREAEIEYKTELLNDFIDHSNEEIEIMKNELTRPVYIKIASVIKNISKEKGYSFVLKKNSDAILYQDREFDLTKEIIIQIKKDLQMENKLNPEEEDNDD